MNMLGWSRGHLRGSNIRALLALSFDDQRRGAWARRSTTTGILREDRDVERESEIDFAGMREEITSKRDAPPKSARYAAFMNEENILLFRSS